MQVNFYGDDKDDDVVVVVDVVVVSVVVVADVKVGNCKSKHRRYLQAASACLILLFVC